MIHPYVGVTGAASICDAREVRRAFSDSRYTSFCPTTSHQPMSGVLVSHKTLNGEKTDNKRYPAFAKTLTMFRHLSGYYPMIHYSTGELSTLADQVEKLFDHVYEYNVCRALQLNISNPPIGQIEKIREKMPEMEIVFAATKTVLDKKSPSEIAKSILPYSGLVNYVLIDPSGGRGEEFNLERSAQIFFEMREKMPHLILGFAGGFSPKNVENRVQRLQELIKTNEFCIDVEGGVRDKLGEEYGNDKLNPSKVREFLFNSHKVLP